jgi:hypothetical protein
VTVLALPAIPGEHPRHLVKVDEREGQYMQDMPYDAEQLAGSRS